MSTIAELIARGGDIAAQRAANQGQIWGQAVQQLGQIGAGALEQHAEQQELKKRDARLAQIVGSGLWQSDPRAAYALTLETMGPQLGPRVAEGMMAAGRLSAGQMADPEDVRKNLQALAGGFAALPDPLKPQTWGSVRGLAERVGLTGLPEEYTPELLPAINAFALGGQAQRAPEGFSLSPGQRRYDAAGKLVAEAPADTKPAEPRVVGRSLVGPDGKVIYRDPESPKQDSEPLVAIMGPDGESVFVPRAQAVGKRPASNREQGRPVFSAEAVRLADMDSALDDLNNLAVELEGSGATGPGAKVGTMIPDSVTALTGWGADPKKTQATIDLIKQAFGKTLEGGVLRKEDEAKYEKILPKIADAPEIVQAKLQSLWRKMEQNRANELDSLEDAGFDVGRYRARPAREKKFGPKEAVLPPATQAAVDRLFARRK